MLDQSQQAGAGRRHRAAYVVLAEPVQGADQVLALALETLQQQVRLGGVAGVAGGAHHPTVGVRVPGRARQRGRRSARSSAALATSVGRPMSIRRSVPQAVPGPYGGALRPMRLLEDGARVVTGVVGLLALLLDLVGLVVDRRQPPAQLVGLALQLEAARVEGADRLLDLGELRLAPRRRDRRPRSPPPRRRPVPRRCRGRRAARPAPAPRRPRPVSRPPRAPPARPRRPSRSSSDIPVEVNAVSIRPVRTTWAATGSSIAALSIPSTWSTTGPVRRTPASRASDRAEVASALVSCRRWRVNARSWSPSERLGRGAQRLGELEHRGDLLGLPTHEQVDRPRCGRGLLELLHRGGERLVARAAPQPVLAPPGCARR